jgi:hypothetical protein
MTDAPPQAAHPLGFRQWNARQARARAAGIAWARAWRDRNRPLFDAMDAAGMFIDSAPPLKE